jgi:hypothetical protein
MGIENGTENFRNPENGVYTSRVFISYGHADDEPFVEKLREDLKKLGYPVVWRDRDSMPSRGLTFLDEIRDAIVDDIDKIILVIGPKAIESKYVQMEWKTGLQLCKTIIPILREGEYQDIPEKIRDYQAADFREKGQTYGQALNELQRHLNETERPLGEMYSVPALPEHYLERENKIQDVKEQILSDLLAPEQSPTKTFAITGDGGSGKSVLAQAVANECEVKRGFPGGVVWVKVGEKTDFFQDLEDIHNHLSGSKEKVGQSNTDQNASETVIKGKVRELVMKSPVLIILDNVWDKKSVEYFQEIVNGTRSRILLTTRDSIEADQVGVSWDIGLFGKDESRKLLLDWAHHESYVSTPEIKGYIERVLKECGNSPIALRVAGAYVGGDNRMWRSLVDYLEHGNFGELNEKFKDDPNLNLFRLTQISAERLRVETQILYSDLAVFQKDRPIPIQDIKVLWARQGYSESHIDNFISQLVGLSLAEYGEDKKTLVLHDLQWDYVRNTSDIPSLHSWIVDSYKKECGGQWHVLKDDGYVFGNLLWHMGEAERYEELYDLCMNFDWLMNSMHSVGIKRIRDQYRYVYHEFLKKLIDPAEHPILIWYASLQDNKVMQISEIVDSLSVIERQAFISGDSQFYTMFRPLIQRAEEGKIVGGYRINFFDGKFKEFFQSIPQSTVEVEVPKIDEDLLFIAHTVDNLPLVSVAANKSLVISCSSRELFLYSPEKRGEIGPPLVPDNPEWADLIKIMLHPQKVIVYSIHEDGVARAIDIERGKYKELRNKEGILGMGWIAGNPYFWCKDGSLIFAREDGTIIGVTHFNKQIRCVASHRFPPNMAIAFSDNTIVWQSFSPPKEPRIIKKLDTPITAIDICSSRSRNEVVCGDEKGRIHILTIEGKNIFEEEEQVFSTPVTTIVLGASYILTGLVPTPTKDGIQLIKTDEFVAVSSRDSIELRNFMFLRQTLWSRKEQEHSINDMAMSPDGKILYYVFENGYLKGWYPHGEVSAGDLLGSF